MPRDLIEGPRGIGRGEHLATLFDRRQNRDGNAVLRDDAGDDELLLARGLS